MANSHDSTEPVACVGSYWNDGKGFDLCDFSGNRPAPGAKLYAAPVAQQPPHDHVAVTWDAARTRILAVTLQDAEGRVLCVIDEAPAQHPQAEVLTDEQRLGWYAWRVKDLEEKLANAQKQPQAKPHKPLFADLIAQHPGLREELLEMDKQPQAEAVPLPTNAAEAELMQKVGLAWLHQHAPERLAPQQAEAVPPDVARDAQRWQVVQCDPNFRTSRWSEDADGWVYATANDVDAAIAQQKGASHE